MNKTEMLETCKKLMIQADTAYLATIDLKGAPQVRAMLNLRCKSQFPGVVKFMDKYAKGFETYFTTNTSSRKIKQIAADNSASVYFNIGFNGVNFTGALEIVKDETVKEAIWQDGWEMYYPKGRKDPDHTLLKFVPKSLKFYSNFKVTEIEL